MLVIYSWYTIVWLIIKQINFNQMKYSFKVVKYYPVLEGNVLFIDIQFVTKKTGGLQSSRSLLEYVQRL